MKVSWCLELLSFNKIATEEIRVPSPWKFLNVRFWENCWFPSMFVFVLTTRGTWKCLSQGGQILRGKVDAALLESTEIDKAKCQSEWAYYPLSKIKRIEVKNEWT